MFFDSGPIKQNILPFHLNYALEKGAKTPATLPQVIVNLRPAKHQELERSLRISGLFFPEPTLYIVEQWLADSSKINADFRGYGFSPA